MSFKVKDHYYKKAKKENFLARSVYKLEEIDKKYQVLRPGQKVLDLGYYPGSWTQYASRVIGPKGEIVGIDLKPVNKKLLTAKNITLFEKDIFDVSSPEDLGLETVDVLLSDMAPNTTGIKSVDQIRSLALVEAVFEFMPRVLRPEGHLVIKVFDGHQAQEFLRLQRKHFQKFDFLKPKSTRSVSKEFFVIGKGYKA